MIDLLEFLLCLLFRWNRDPEIDNPRAGIVLIFLFVFLILLVVFSGAILAIRQG